MLNPCYHIFLIFLGLLLLSAIHSNAQQIIDGQVIDKQTELAIQGVTVKLIKAGSATQTTAQGYFEVTADSTINADTLSFTSVGYKPYKLAVKGNERQLFITLEQSVTKLNEVNVNGNKAKDQILSRFIWADLKEVNSPAYTHFTIPILARVGLAKLFVAPQSNALLVNIMFGRRPLSSTLYAPFSSDGKMARFYIHLCAVDPDTEEPGKILLTKEVVLLDNSLKITLDLSAEKFVIPDTKFYVMIEWIRTPLNEIITLNYKNKAERARLDGRVFDQEVTRYMVYYRPVLIGYPTTEPKAVKWLKMDDKWLPYMDKDYELAMAVTVRY